VSYTNLPQGWQEARYFEHPTVETTNPLRHKEMGFLLLHVNSQFVLAFRASFVQRLLERV
jgi:hypothetical protein